MLHFLLRVVLLLVGLVFAASLALALLLLMVLWLLRAGWAALTGRPISPWVMRVDPRAGFERFRERASHPAEPDAAARANARARGQAVDSPVTLLRPDAVTDVPARPAAPPER